MSQIKEGPNRPNIVAYIAGPFRASNAWEIEQNCRRAEEVAAWMMLTYGVMPMIPHANTRFFHGTRSDQFWLDGTLEMLRRCDLLVVCPGFERSAGTKNEILEAERLKLPIVFVHLHWNGLFKIVRTTNLPEVGHRNPTASHSTRFEHWLNNRVIWKKAD